MRVRNVLRNSMILNSFFNAAGSRFVPRYATFTPWDRRILFAVIAILATIFCMLSLLSPFPVPIPTCIAKSPVGRWWVRGGWKRRNLQAKTNQSNPLCVLEKHPSLPPSRSLQWFGYGEGGIHPTSGKKPTTVDEHFVNGSLSLSLFSRLPLVAVADNNFSEPKVNNFSNV